MQKTKRIILECIKLYGPVDRFKIRQYFKDVYSPTNTNSLMLHVEALVKIGCLKDANGSYTITEKGEKLFNLIKQINEILK